MEHTAHREWRLSPVNMLRWSCCSLMVDVHMSHAVMHAVAADELASKHKKARLIH